MNDILELWEKPTAQKMYMIAGWRQWADAGNVSSGLPQYLIEQTEARKIGEIRTDGFYLFQIPGTHHLLRPVVKLADGYREQMEIKRNEFYYTGNDRVGLVIFLGDEPHLNADHYADAFFDAARELGVRRIAVVGGVYGAMPYEKDRQISCAYSLREMRDELAKYAVRFSDYEGGATIGTYLIDRAEPSEIECLVFYAMIPAYDFSQLEVSVQGMRIENDFKAWYDIMRRFIHMFGLEFDLTDLESQSYELILSLDSEIEELDKKMPALKVRQYMEQVSAEFTEMPFEPLDDVWERGLRDLFRDMED